MTCRATNFFECLSSFCYCLNHYWVIWNDLNGDGLSSLPDNQCRDITACGFVIVTITIIPLVERVNLFFGIIFQPFIRCRVEELISKYNPPTEVKFYLL